MTCLTSPRYATGRTYSADEVETLAQRRAAARMGWYVHALVFVAVNSALSLLAWLSGHHWAIYPMLGWGLGLLLHGAGVWLSLGGGGLQQRLLAQERARLAPLRDPW